MSSFEDDLAALAAGSKNKVSQETPSVVSSSSRKKKGHDVDVIAAAQPPSRELHKTVLIPNSLHNKLSLITSVGYHGSLSLTAFISNIIARHLEDYKDEYTALIEKQMKERAW